MVQESPKSKIITPGVSVITCTKRQHFIDNVLKNYAGQSWKKKELIIVLNKDDMNIAEYTSMASNFQNVCVYQLPETTTLGECLNFGVKKARYRYVAKFDDDDYYAPPYLAEYMEVFKKTNADVVGKRAHYMWLYGPEMLLLRFPKSENKFVSILPGATLVIKKAVFKKVKFSDVNLGEDDGFCRKCKKRGFKLYSAGKYNFAATRRANSLDHTWIISKERLLSKSHEIIPDVEDYRYYVTRSHDYIIETTTTQIPNPE